MRATTPCEPTQSHGPTIMTNEMKRRENITGWDRDPRLRVGLDRAVIVRATRRASEGLYEPRDSARAFFATIASTTLWETKLADGFSHL